MEMLVNYIQIYFHCRKVLGLRPVAAWRHAMLANLLEQMKK